MIALPIFYYSTDLIFNLKIAYLIIIPSVGKQGTEGIFTAWIQCQSKIPDIGGQDG